MKKIFTLVAGMLLTAAVFAANRKPVVTVDNKKNYKIVIDGKSYFGDNLTIRLQDNFRNAHSIKVYEMQRGLYVKGEKLVDAAIFKVDRKDVSITIDRRGNIKIREANLFGWNKKDDKGFGKSQQKGKVDIKKDLPGKRF